MSEVGIIGFTVFGTYVLGVWMTLFILGILYGREVGCLWVGVDGLDLLVSVFWPVTLLVFIMVQIAGLVDKCIKLIPRIDLISRVFFLSTLVFRPHTLGLLVMKKVRERKMKRHGH